MVAPSARASRRYADAGAAGLANGCRNGGGVSVVGVEVIAARRYRSDPLVVLGWDFHVVCANRDPEGSEVAAAHVATATEVAAATEVATAAAAPAVGRRAVLATATAAPAPATPAEHRPEEQAGEQPDTGEEP